MVRHAKNSGHEGHFTYQERQRVQAVKTERLQAISQTPFGHCALSLQPIKEGDCVISPSGRLYSREAIYEYLLQKTRDLKELTILYEEQQMKKIRDSEELKAADYGEQVAAFCATQDGVQGIIQGTVAVGDKRGREDGVYISGASRRKIIDDSTHDEKLVQLQKISPWIAQFTPSAKASDIRQPPKRPPSPFSGNPLRSKDLLPVSLMRDGSSASSSSSCSSSAGTSGTPVLYVCPVSQKTITNQPLVYIKTTGALMLESVAKELAFKTMICPLTSKRFKMEDVLPVVQAASSFSSTGTVEASRFRHVGIN